MTLAHEFLPRDDLSEALYINRKLDSEFALHTAHDPANQEVYHSGKLQEAASQESPSVPSQNIITTKLHDPQSSLPSASLSSASLSSASLPSKSLPSKYLPSESLPSKSLPSEFLPSESRSPANWTPRKVLAGAHQGWVRSLCVDPVTNEWFVSGSSDALIKVWNLASGHIKATLPGHIMAVRSLAISQRHPYLFSGSEDKTLRCWDLERTNAPAGCQIRDYHGHVGGVYALALHPELDLLFSGGRDSAIRVWDIRSKTQVMVLTGHTNDVTSLVAQTGDPQVCSSSMDGTLRLWDVRMQRCHLALTHHSKSVRSMSLHPTESTLVSADSTGSIKQWVLPQGTLLNGFGPSNQPLEPGYDANIINTLSVNPATNELFAGFDDGRMHFYDYETGHLQQSTTTVASEGTASAKIYASVFDNSGMRLITGENDKSIKIWGAD